MRLLGALVLLALAVLMLIGSVSEAMRARPVSPHIEKREAFVFEALSSLRVPVAYVHAGGYASLETLTALHLITARAAQRALSQ
jgi:hypothetical protein